MYIYIYIYIFIWIQHFVPNWWVETQYLVPSGISSPILVGTKSLRLISRLLLHSRNLSGIMLC